MMKKSTLTKLISGIVIGGLVLSIGGIAMADTKSDNSNNSKPGMRDSKSPGGMMRGDKIGQPPMGGPQGRMNNDGQEKLQAALKELVAGGTITQTKVDELQAYATKKNEERKAEFEKMKNMTAEERKALRNKQQGERPGLFGDAVKDGILTQEQADVIMNKVQQMAQDERKKQMTDNLNTLVTNGTITADQMNKVLDSIGKQEQNMKDMFEKIKNMTPQERQEYMKNNAGAKKGPFSQLVDDGTLTKEQSDAIAKVLHPRGVGPEGGKRPGGHGLKDGSIPENNIK